ncbi:hypothetical protein PPL_06750 [Heterostelium album PN500]|uniref:Uncharacterized protein n=1 Tax=Heterostelium pallidum (strain ATCC 26659 / Pp 5 / PN500) TaxID=670386 RepID=D3BFL5_HETP5|nr:hypothetical protein PPL_06750 [Heterostelium album PN500]EFA79929.1 hypothetical protein PPL_06750 [Heterostelium album PN500]|eukprot:XP_020432049.1 hypothetical protein PPL_06750 [Heterostelium album PN500]
MGQKSSRISSSRVINKNNNNNIDYSQFLEKSNQTILPDLIWRKILSLLSEFECGYHRYEWNPLSLSLISHYWLVNILAKSTLRITVTNHRSLFLINYPFSYQRSFKKFNSYSLNNINNNNNNNNNNNKDIKFKINRFTLIFDNDNRLEIKEFFQMVSDYYWIDYYNEVLLDHWQINSMTIVNLPDSLKLHSLAIAPTLKRLTVYSMNANRVQVRYFTSLERFHLEQSHSSHTELLPPVLNANELKSLTSLSIASCFNNRLPWQSNDSVSALVNLKTLELNHIHIYQWIRNQVNDLPIQLSRLCPNVTKLKLNHVYHRMVHTYNLTDRPSSLLGDLKHLSYLSITNKSPITSYRDRDNHTLNQEYTADVGLTNRVFLLDIHTIGQQLDTLKLKGVTPFQSLLTSINHLSRLRRLSISDYLEKHHVDSILSCESLIRLSVNFKFGNVLLYFLKNNKHIKIIKDNRFSGCDTNSLIETLGAIKTNNKDNNNQTIIEELKLICHPDDYNTIQQQQLNQLATNYFVTTNFKISIINHQYYKQPRKMNQSQYFINPVPLNDPNEK